MRIGCVLLASGLSERFGRNKLLEKVQGKPLVERAMDALPVELFCDVVVVTAYDEIHTLARAKGLRSIHNDSPQSGISHTIKLGTQEMTNMDACMFCVCDQPYLDPYTLFGFVSGYKEGIAALAYKRQRGNPVIFPQELYGELMSLGRGESGNRVIERHEELLSLHQVQNARELWDIDYASDIAVGSRNLFVTGQSGIGKSTLLQEVLLPYMPVVTGFETRPYGINGQYAGYYLHGLSPLICPGDNDKPISVRTGERQRIPITAVFEQFGCQYLDAALEDTGKIILMDELGDLEEGAEAFQSKVKECLSGKKTVLGVVKDIASEWLGKIKRREDTEILMLDERNEQKTRQKIIEFLHTINA